MVLEVAPDVTAVISEYSDSGSHHCPLSSSLLNITDDSIKNKNWCQLEKETFALNDHIINKQQNNEKTTGNEFGIVKIYIKERPRMKLCDM